MGASAWRRRDDRRRDTFARIGVMYLAVVLTAALVAPAGARSAFEGAVALVPQTPRGVGNCIPFANNTSFGFSGFIYRDVPSFRLEPGTRFAFDLGGVNDRDVRRNISFAVGSRNPSPGNGGVRALGWTQVVSDAQLPLNPRGNTIVGDYELEYTSEASFDFPGGGLVVGFGASPPGAYADTGCEQVLVHTDSNDPSGYFYARFWGKSDRTLNVLDSGDWDMRWLGGLVIYSDSSPPVTTASVDPPPDADGWADPPVTVTL